jgi:hypothetical protein
MRPGLLTLLAAAAAAAAGAYLGRRGRSAPAPAPPAPMPPPTAPPAPPAAAEAAPPAAAEPAAPTAAEPVPGPRDEGEPGAITHAPVPEAPAPAASERPDDDTLEQAVETRIAEDPAVPEAGVEVEVEDGVAELRGTVADPTTATRVSDAAAHVDGVIGVDNQLDTHGSDPAAAPERDREEEERPEE